MRVSERYELEIFLDGLNIFETPGIVFNGADIFEAIANPIPTCSLDVIIPLEWVDNRSIADGSEIKFNIKFLETLIPTSASYTFRLFNVKRLNVEQNFVHVLLEGLIDFYKGYEEGNQFNKYGNSSEVILKIANNQLIEADIDTTNDKQLWVAGENNVYQFINYMTEHAWINETSAMFWCFDREKRLLYKNLTDLFRKRQNNIFTFVQTPEAYVDNKEFTYTKVSAAIQSGTNNLFNGGYGGDDYGFDFLTYSPTTITAKKVVAESQLININKELSHGLANVWFPFDIGNAHSHFLLAAKQNHRILSTYSTYLRLESQFFQPYRLAQIVKFEYLDAQDPNNKLKSLSGVYMIDAIHVKLSTANITSTIELMMQGMNGQVLTAEVF